MKMRILISLILVVTIGIGLVVILGKSDKPKYLIREGVAPYDLTESEKYILESFGMKHKAQVISFHAPKEAITLHVNAYKFDGVDNWISIGGGGISIGTEREPTKRLKGTFAIQLKENNVIEFNINASGRSTYKTEEIILNTETMASAIGFLHEFQTIELNKEIPVALMVYDRATSMRTYNLQHFFEPSQFSGMDLVQVVTFTFTDKDL